MNVALNLRPPSAAVRMRTATDAIHRRLEARLDIVERLADPARRPDLMRRYAALHIPADEALGPYLSTLPGLDFFGRSRAPLLARFLGDAPPPAFPLPVTRAEALGMLYVLEGSTLGGRIILRMLASRGVHDPSLAFLDPYGAQTGARWRGFLAVLARESDGDEERIAQACDGAQSGFLHAERLLCQGTP